MNIASPGFSWKTNQFGLTIDNTVEYELVMPNGTIASITATSSPDLFWGLKVSVRLTIVITLMLTSAQGGYNNFVNTHFDIVKLSILRLAFTRAL